MPRVSLARYPLFNLLPAGQLDDWLAAGQEAAFATGATVFQEDTPGAWVYLVRDGRVRVVRRSSGGGEVGLGMLLPGDAFGEYALLPPGQNTATCRAAAPSRLLCLPLAPLRAAVKEFKPVWRNLKNWLRLHTVLHFHRDRSFLGFMSAQSGLKLLDLLRPADFAAGETIQAGGLAADRWHLIERGMVRFRADGGCVDLGPGDGFGEAALSGSGTPPVAEALSDVRCQTLARHDFDPAAPRSAVAQSYQPRGPARPAAHVWVPQRERADCGLAALAMVAGRRGLGVGVEDLRAKVTPGRDGLSLQQMRTLAAEIGLPCEAVRVSANRLDQVSLPAVAHLTDGHYVVLHELAETGAVVGDPAAGVVGWSRTFLERCYSGALLLFDAPTGAV